MKSFLARHGVDWHYFIIAVLACGVGVTAFVYSLQYGAAAEARAESEALTAEITLVRERLEATETENEQLRTFLQQESEKNAAFGKRVDELANSVGYLDKLSKTDRELLQKYSSVYFLSENFIPDPLVPIDNELLARSGGDVMLHGQVFPFLKEMMQAAENNGTPLKVLSAYRSFGAQSSLKVSYKVTYGAGTANQFSADQGYSEHQLGSTVDFTTADQPESLAAFKGSPQYNWLVSHAHEYGWVLSYPEGNSFFTFEPWHWRFVGVELAKRLYFENKHFYDLDQREINPYLARIFDQ